METQTMQLQKPLKANESPVVHMEVPSFTIPVDSEYKSKTLKLWMLSAPHMRCFHLSWIAFFITFLATFAPASLIPVIRNNLNSTKTELNNAGIGSVIGAIAARVGMGTVADLIGPRRATATALFITAPAVFCMTMVSSNIGFFWARLAIGCSLCMFVCCQYWVGSMFTPRIVGTANAIAAGWGNMGGGICHFVMPALYDDFQKRGFPDFQAWRWTFFIPGSLYIASGISVLCLGQDSPVGDFRDLKAKGQMAKGAGQTWALVKCAALNYRTWILLLLYGYSFGVELTVDNVIVQYFFNTFALDLSTAGNLGALFGLMNLFSRASGGIISDIMAHYFGMRGRLWTLWTLQTLGGVFCLLLYYVADQLGATVGIMIIFSIFIQQACGAAFAIVPFVSRRAYGAVSGFVGAGGNAGAGVTQAIFFGSLPYTNQEGFRWMGVMTMCISLLTMLIHFPMWGSMWFPASETATEEDYYMSEWTPEEMAAGLHSMALKFADESKSNRGMAYFVRMNTDRSGSLHHQKSGSLHHQKSGSLHQKNTSLLGPLQGTREDVSSHGGLYGPTEDVVVLPAEREEKAVPVAVV